MFSLFLSILGYLAIIGWLLLIAGAFFMPVKQWQNSCIHYQRGQELVVEQKVVHLSMKSRRRRVRVIPVTPFFYWVERLRNAATYVPPTPPEGARWVAINKKAEDFSSDPAEERRINASREADRRCWADRCREDSLARVGKAPLLRLPAATQHAANTIGCLVDGEVWRNYLVRFKDGRYRHDGAMAVLEAAPYQPKGTLHLWVYAHMRFGGKLRHIDLQPPRLQGKGIYPLVGGYRGAAVATGPFITLGGDSIVGYSSKFDGNAPTVASMPGAIVIMRFDTVAKIISGTFQGQVLRQDGKGAPIPLQQGRFDVRYRQGP